MLASYELSLCCSKKVVLIAMGDLLRDMYLIRHNENFYIRLPCTMSKPIVILQRSRYFGYMLKSRYEYVQYTVLYLERD